MRDLQAAAAPDACEVSVSQSWLQTSLFGDAGVASASQMPAR